jgi:hypothetical protein
MGGGFGGGHIGSFGGGRMAGMGRDHFDGGRRRFGGGYYGYGLDCPYYQTYYWPDTCTY